MSGSALRPPLRSVSRKIEPLPQPGEPVGLSAAVLAGGWAVAVSWLAMALPVLLAWSLSARTQAGWGQALRVGTDAWLLIHGVALSVPGGRLHFVPLLATALPLWLCLRAGRRIGAGVMVGQRAPAQVLRQAGPAIGCFTVTYATVLVASALVAAGDGVRPEPIWAIRAVGGVLLTLGLGTLAGLLQQIDRGLVDGVLRILRVPSVIRRNLRSGVAMVAGVLAVAVGLLLTVIAFRFDEISGVYGVLGTGVAGGVILTGLQLLVVPNLILWAMAFVAGPGFGFGSEATVSPLGSSVMEVPLLPVFAVLSPAGPFPLVMLAVVLLPVGVGVWSGFRLARRGEAAWQVLAADIGVSSPFAAICLGLLAATCGGQLGPAGFEVGPSPWLTGLALGLELAGGAAVGAWVGRR